MTDYKKEAHASHAAKTHRMARGGHPDAAADRALVNRMVKPDALTGKAKGGTCHAHGGKAGKKPRTQVNVLVAPRGDGARAVPVPVGGMQAPAPRSGLPSLAGAPVSPPMGAGGLGALAGAPGRMPVGAKAGGKVAKRTVGGPVKGYDAGAGSGEGRLEKEHHMRKEKKLK